MKACDSGLKPFLDALRAQPDRTVLAVECYAFALQGGQILRYTTADVDIAYNGDAYLASGPLVEGLEFNSTIGFNVDKQDVKIRSASADFIASIANGAFDDCEITRIRVYFSDEIGGSVVGGVVLYHGRVVAVEECGAAQAILKVSDDLVTLENQMPRNAYFVTCCHVLFDQGCGLNKTAFAVSATALSGSTDRTILTGLAVFGHIGGTVLFTSGVNAGLSATIKNAKAGVNLTLSYPLPEAPAPGDAFTIYPGCDHTLPTCANVFANQARFRGFPFIPPPQNAQ